LILTLYQINLIDMTYFYSDNLLPKIQYERHPKACIKLSRTQ